MAMAKDRNIGRLIGEIESLRIAARVRLADSHSVNVLALTPDEYKVIYARRAVLEALFNQGYRAVVALESATRFSRDEIEYAERLVNETLETLVKDSENFDSRASFALATYSTLIRANEIHNEALAARR